MKKIYLTILVLLSVFGCTQNRLDMNEVDKQLDTESKTLVYDIKIQDIMNGYMEYSSQFSEFPFIAQNKKNNFKGKYSSKFYKKNRVTLHSQRMDKVDYNALQKDYKSLDIIYTKHLWINQYKHYGNDLFFNLCYAHRLSYKEQSILKDWIKKGGTFWIEKGLFLVGNELDKIPEEEENLTFLDFNVSKYFFKKTDESKVVLFKNIKTVKEFQKIKSLQIDLDYKQEINFIIDGSVMLLSKSQVLLSISKYAKGKIISILPFEFSNLHRDGELLRWELLNLIKKGTDPDGLKISVLKKEPVKAKKEQITEGLCIQIFSTYTHDDALRYIQYSKSFALSRVEKRGKVFTGRVGMYSCMKDAHEDFINLKKIYPNAFIRRCVYKKQNR